MLKSLTKDEKTTLLQCATLKKKKIMDGDLRDNIF